MNDDTVDRIDICNLHAARDPPGHQGRPQDHFEDFGKFNDAVNSLIFFVDLPGFMIGPQAEYGATLREAMRSPHARMQATLPMMSVVIRKCYGFAEFAARNSLGLESKIAWPSAEIDSLPVEGGTRFAARGGLAPDLNQQFLMSFPKTRGH